MNLSNLRTESVYQTWDLLVGLSRDTNLPHDVRRGANWLLRHYSFSQKVHRSSPVLPDTQDEGVVQREQRADRSTDSMPLMRLPVGRRHR